MSSHISALVAGASIKKTVIVSTSTTSGQIAAIVNPEAEAVLVTRTLLHVRTGASAACTLNIGSAANGTTSSDNLLDGISVNTSANTLYDNIEDQGSNGASRQYLAAGEYITATVATGDANGLVADLYINYQPLTGG